MQRWLDDPLVPRLDPAPCPAHSLVLLTRGAVTMQERSGRAWRRAEWTPGSFALNPADSARTLRWQTTTSRPVQSVHIFLHPDLIAETAEAFIGSTTRAFPDVFTSQQPQIAHQARVLEWSLDKAAPALVADAVATVLVGGIIAGDSTHRPRGGALAPRALARVIAQMHADLAADLTLDELAATANLSRFHFLRAFTVATGSTPHRYLRDIRLEAAEQLLRHSQMTVQEIANRCGWSSAARFAGAFRDRYSLNPAAYRSSTR